MDSRRVVTRPAHGSEVLTHLFIYLRRASVRTGRHRAAAKKAAKKAWVAPAGACWQLNGERLRNRGTGGVLNVRPGGNLRGHGNSGPPWRADDGLEGEETSLVSLRAVPRQLREAASSGSYGRRGHGGGGGGGGSVRGPSRWAMARRSRGLGCCRPAAKRRPRLLPSRVEAEASAAAACRCCWC